LTSGNSYCIYILYSFIFEEDIPRVIIFDHNLTHHKLSAKEIYPHPVPDQSLSRDTGTTTTMMMSHFDLPVRNRKDLARAAQLRSLALARPVLPSSPYGNNTYPSPNRRSIRPSRNNMTNNSTTNPYYLPTLLDPYLTSSQTDIHLLDNLAPKPYYHPSSPSPYHHHHSSSSLDNNHNHPSSSSATGSSSSYPRRSLHSSNPHHSSPTRPSFQKAARALSVALLNAYHQAERLEGDFAAETRYLHYADQRVLALLWRSKVGFSGWRDELGESGNDDGDEDEDAEGFGQTDRRDDGRERRAGDENLFAVCAGKLLDAIEDMKDAGRAWLRGEGSGSSFSSFSSGVTGGHGEFGDSHGVGVEDVRLAMKKLSVSFGALAELLEGVRLEKSRCPVLVRELRSNQDVLLGIRGVWEVPSRSGGGGGRRRDNFSNAATAGGGGGKIPVAAFVEEDWENSSYRGE
jgi:hypothetical protein